MADSQPSPKTTGTQQLSHLRGHYRWMIHSALLNACAQCVGGGNRVGYAKALGAKADDIGNLASLVLFAQMAQIISPSIVERMRSRKPFCLCLDIVSRLSWFVIALIPLLFRGAYRVLAIVLMAPVATFFADSVVPAKQSWVADLVRHRMRGRFFGMNNLFAHGASFFMLMASGLYVDYWLTRIGLWSYSTLIIFGTCLALGGLWFLSRVPEPPKAMSPQPGPLRFLTLPLLHPDFRNLIIFFGFRSAMVQVGAGFFDYFMLDDLGMNQTQVNTVRTANFFFAAFSNPFWGPLVDRFGPKRMLWFGATAQVIIPFTWALANRDNWWWVLPLSQSFGGLLLPPVSLAQLKLILQTAPRENRTMYLGGFNALFNLIAATGPQAGNVLRRVFERTQPVLLGYAVTPLKGLFLVSTVGRAVALLPLWLLVKEPKGLKG